MEHLNEMIIENLISQLNFESFRNYFLAANKHIQATIRGLMSYDFIAKRMIAKAIRECFQNYPSIDLLTELDKFVGFDQMGWDTDIYSKLVREKSKNFQSKLDLNHPYDKIIYKELDSEDGLMLIGEQKNFYGQHAKNLLEIIDQEMDVWNDDLRDFILRDATSEQVYVFGKGLAKYLKSFGKYQSDAMRDYILCMKPKLNFLANQIGVSFSLLNSL